MIVVYFLIYALLSLLFYFRLSKKIIWFQALCFSWLKKIASSEKPYELMALRGGFLLFPILIPNALIGAKQSHGTRRLLRAKNKSALAMTAE